MATLGKKRVWFGILFSAVFFGMLLEVGIRYSELYTTLSEKTGGTFISLFSVQHEGVYYTHRPLDTIRIRSREFNYDHMMDSAGFRNTRLPGDTVSYSVLAFGDSFTEGLGAPQDSTWPVQLGRLTGQKVYNAGIMGSDPVYAYKMLKELRWGFDPETVLVAVNYSDITDWVIRGDEERFGTDTVHYRPAPWFMPLYRYSHFFRAVLHLVFRYDYMLTPPGERETRLRQAMDGLVQVLGAMHTHCQNKGARFFVFVHPVPQEYYRNMDMRLNFRRVDELVPALQTAGVDAVNLRPGFEAHLKTADDWKNHSWPVDGHFNAKGYALMASLMASILRDSVNTAY